MIIFSKDSVVLRAHKNAQRYSIEKETKKAVIEEKESIVDLNRSQLRIGIDSKGEKFGDYRSGIYAKWKRSKSTYKAPFPTPDLFVTGTLQNKMELNISGSRVVIESTDPMSSEKLEGRFGDAFGINKNIAPITEQIVTYAFNINTYKLLFK